MSNDPEIKETATFSEGARVVVCEKNDLHEGRSGVIERRQQGPWIGRWPVLVRFEDGDTRWYRDEHLEQPS